MRTICKHAICGGVAIFGALRRIVCCLFISMLLGVEAFAGNADWHGAQWVGATVDAKDSLACRSIVLQHGITCGRKISEATLKITGLGAYEVYFNGTPANDNILAPAWSDYNKTVFYNTLDVTSLLKKGYNTVSVLLGNAFYHERGERYNKTKTNYGPLTMLLCLDIEYENGKRQTLVSDDSWHWTVSPVTFNSIYGGEDYDARMRFYDAVKARQAVVQQAPKGVLREQIANPIRIMERFDVKSRQRLADLAIPEISKEVKHSVPNGSFVLDMGQNLSGFPEITVSGKAGQKVTMYVSETLTANGACNQRQSGRPYYYVYTLAGDVREKWHPHFSYYGYRYIQVEGAVMEGDDNPDGLPVLHRVQSCFIYNSAKKIGSFECSNPRFNATYNLIDRAVRSNWQHVWTDCPHREKLGWLEQDWLNGEGLVYNYDCRSMIEQTMRVIADAMHDDGSLPEIAPEYITFEGSWAPPFQQSPEWGGAVVALPFLYKKHYGSDKMIREYYGFMKCYVDYLATQDSCFILRQGLGDWYDYGPWRAGFARNTSMPFVSTAHFYKWTYMTAEAAAMLGKHDEATVLLQRANQIKAAINRDFYNPLTHQYDTGSQCANAIALDMSLCEDADRKAVLNNLVADIFSHGQRLTTGDVGNRYLFKVLAEAPAITLPDSTESTGPELLYAMLNHDDVPGYGFQIQKGMTTLTEQWNPEMGASMNHFMLAHINNHLIQTFGGINIDGKTVRIDPKVVGDLQWVKASTVTEYGVVRVEWHRDANGGEKIEYAVPAGMKVEVAEKK